MSRQNLEDNLSKNLRLTAPRLGNLKLALLGAFAITFDGPSVYSLDPNGADRTITLPTPSASKGSLVLYIRNSGSANFLNLVDHLGAAVTSIGVGGMAIVVSGTTSWNLVAAVPSTQYIPDGTVALPGLAFNLDRDTGIYRIGANNLGIAVGGTKILDIGASGINVIGSISIGGAVFGSLIAGSNYNVWGGGNVATTGSNNVSIAPSAGAANASATNSVFIGVGAGSALLSGNATFALGTNTLGRATSAQNTVAIGVNAARGFAAGTQDWSQTIAIGTNALLPLVNGATGNIGIGFAAGNLTSPGTISGLNNIFIGSGAGIFDSSGAATANIAGSSNIVIGTNNNMLPNHAASNQLNIGNLLFGTGISTTNTLSTGKIGIGVISPAYTLDVFGQIASTNSSGGIGYGTGAGGTVAQSTSKSTGVTLDKVCGTITMDAATLNAGTTVGFTLTNATIAATDTVSVSIKSGASADSYSVQVSAIASGSCRIELRNTSAGNLSEAVVLSFAVLRGVAS